MTQSNKLEIANLPSFDMTKAFQVLTQFAKTPIDLTNEKLLTAQRIQNMQAEGAGFKLLYGFERVDSQVLSSLEALADERKAVDQMQAMQNGVIANFIEGYPSENRAVLHTAMRDIFTDSIAEKEALEAREKAKEEHKKLQSFSEMLDKENRFKEMIFIGIGGSELGPKALYLALSGYHRIDRKIHFVCNVDPDDVALVMKRVDLSSTLVVVISKSGTTLETATNEEYVRSYFVQAGIDPKRHFISVTMPKTPMDNESKYLACFHIWDYVGGRYSATSMVGGLLISFGVGYKEFVELLKGAHDMDLVALKKNLYENLPLLAALIGVWNRNFLHYPTVAAIPYSQMLTRFPAHLQQCDMESNGKRVDRMGNMVSFQTGPVIWGEPGTNAQHSFFQLIHQGTDTIPLEMIGFVESQCGVDFTWKETTSQEKLLSNLFAQAIALAVGQRNENPNKVFPGNRPSSLLLAKKLTPYALGALLAYYEHKTAFQGFIWGINSFDQEGVQLGKVLADKTLALFEAKKSGKGKESFELGQALVTIAATF